MNEENTICAWRVGGAEVDITPEGSPYLCGYPGADRFAAGVHDPILASAICVESEGGAVCILVACDLLGLPCGLAGRARQRIVELLSDRCRHGLGIEGVMLSATHTHSGPLTVGMVTNLADPRMPVPDPEYLALLEERIVEAAAAAFDCRRPARLFSAIASGAELGTHRRDPAGPSNPRLPVLIARDAQSDEPIAVMAVCSMHPTVLHEDSLVISGDFPGLARRWLQHEVVGLNCPLVYHMGASGNQSPRHVVQANTISEAARLGEVLGREIADAIARAAPLASDRLQFSVKGVDLPVRSFGPQADAERRVENAEARWRKLQGDGASRAVVRTAEVDWFGSRKALALSKASEIGLLDKAVRERMPAQVQVIQIGEHAFVGWPGEVFVEFALDLMADFPDATVITLANGDLHGYIVTPDAIAAGSYEAAHAVFESPASGEILVKTARSMLREMG